MPGIYIHIPFCNSKCIYCDFYSVTNQSLRPSFIEALFKEIDLIKSEVNHLTFDTIYFGGGTPSLLSYDEFARIFEKLFQCLTIENNSEISIEANPGTLNNNSLTAFRNLPINRISLGVQSFFDDDLQFLTRIHTAEDARNSIKEIQDAGFENISIDMIFGLPSQSLAEWIQNLEIAVSLNIKHISAYSLTYEKNTQLEYLLENGKIKKMKNELESEIYLKTLDFLEEAGFRQYEVSNFAKEGYRCRHNLNYWKCGEYIGLGPSAASYLDNYRFVNVRNLEVYVKEILSGKSTCEKKEYIDNKKALYEFIFLGLRSEGIDCIKFRDKFGYDFLNEYGKSLSVLFSGGFASKDENVIKLTPEGYAICDEIVSTIF